MLYVCTCIVYELYFYSFKLHITFIISHNNNLFAFINVPGAKNGMTLLRHFLNILKEKIKVFIFFIQGQKGEDSKNNFQPIISIVNFLPIGPRV